MPGATDNITFLNATGGTEIQATDSVSSVHYPRVKRSVGPDNTATDFLDQLTVSQTFTATANGATQNVSAQGMSKFGLQVTKTGSVTSWTVVLEVSLDGTTFTTLIAHTDVTPGNGLMQFPPSPIAFPALYWRLRCSAITLGAGTNVIAIGVGLP